MNDLENGHFALTKKHIEIVRDYPLLTDKLQFLCKKYGTKQDQYRGLLLSCLHKSYQGEFEEQYAMLMDGMTGDDCSKWQQQPEMITPVDKVTRDELTKILNEIYKLLRQHYDEDIAESLFTKLEKAVWDSPQVFDMFAYTKRKAK